MAAHVPPAGGPPDKPESDHDKGELEFEAVDQRKKGVALDEDTRRKKAAEDANDANRLDFAQKDALSKAASHPKITQDFSDEDKKNKEKPKEKSEEKKSGGHPDHHNKEELSFWKVGTIMADAGGNAIKSTIGKYIGEPTKKFIEERFSPKFSKEAKEQGEQFKEAEGALKDAAKDGPKGKTTEPIVPLKDAKDAVTPPLVKHREEPETTSTPKPERQAPKR